MTITVEAVYENGTLKLEHPLPLREHEKVRVTVDRHPGRVAVPETDGGCGAITMTAASAPRKLAASSQ